MLGISILADLYQASSLESDRVCTRTSSTATGQSLPIFFMPVASPPPALDETLVVPRLSASLWDPSLYPILQICRSSRCAAGPSVMVASDPRLDGFGTPVTLVQIHVDAYMLTLRSRKSAEVFVAQSHTGSLSRLTDLCTCCLLSIQPA
jgi:hypothetical protein